MAYTSSTIHLYTLANQCTMHTHLLLALSSLSILLLLSNPTTATEEELISDEEKARICGIVNARLKPTGEEQPIDFPCQVTRPEDDDEYESGFYDGLGNPITESEFLHQAEYEDRTGLPYYRNRTRELERLKEPISVIIYAGHDCGQQPGESSQSSTIHDADECASNTRGESYYLNSLPSNCDVLTFTDGECSEGGEVMASGIFDPDAQCYVTDAFGSVRVRCGELPD